MKTHFLCRAVWLPLVVLAALSTSRATADDFRIETKVFLGKEPKPSQGEKDEGPQPASENVTLFRGGQVYDFMTKPAEITVFDKPRGRVILLDPARKLMAEIKSDRLTAFSDELKNWAGRQTDPFLKFTAEPRFEQTLDEKSGEMVFTSSFIVYRVATIKADNDAIAQQYREFADSYARLNAMTNPGKVPPFPRLAVDETLFKSRLIPERVQVTIPSQRFGGKATSISSEHEVNWRLLEKDLQRISEADEYLVTFTPVPLEQYLRTGQADAKH